MTNGAHCMRAEGQEWEQDRKAIPALVQNGLGLRSIKVR